MPTNSQTGETGSGCCTNAALANAEPVQLWACLLRAKVACALWFQTRPLPDQASAGAGRVARTAQLVEALPA